MITFVVIVVVVSLSWRAVAYLAGDTSRKIAQRSDTALPQRTASIQPSDTDDPVGQWTSIDDIQLRRLLGGQRDKGQRD